MFLCVGLSENPAEYLFYVHSGGFVRHGSEDIRKRAVPALSERIYRNNVSDFTIGA